MAVPLSLTPERGLLFRITHIRNLSWLLQNGLHCAKGANSDPDFVSIGNSELIAKRTHHPVPISPGGTLADYVPFYFTPKSPMLLNIKTGYSGIVRRPNEEIVVLVSSCDAVLNSGVAMLFTDRHPYTLTAQWTGNRNDLAHLIDWDILCRHDFAREDGYPDKMDRYMAEALAHRFVSSNALFGIGCVSESVRSVVEAKAQASGSPARVVVHPQWYF